MKTKTINREVLARVLNRQIERIDAAHSVAMSRIDGDADIEEMEVLSEAEATVSTLKAVVNILTQKGRTRDIGKVFSYQCRELIDLREVNNGTY